VISCDRGRITIENGKVSVSRLRDSISERTTNDKRLMGNLESDTRDINLPAEGNMLAVFYDDFAAAEQGNSILTCPGAEGRNAVELANAMILSSVRGEAITLPLNREDYSQLVEKMMGRELQTV